MVLAPAPNVGQLAIGAAMGRLGDAVDIATLVVLEILLQVESRVAVRVRRATGARERRLPTLGAELPVHLARHVEAAVAP